MKDLSSYRLYIFGADDTLRRCLVPGQPSPYAPGEWELLPGVRDRLTDGTFDWQERHIFAIASNQPGISIDMLTETTALQMLISTSAAATGVYPRSGSIEFCHHFLPEEGCGCQMPRPGMLTTLMRRFRAQPDETIMIGFQQNECEAAHAAGIDFMDAWTFFGWKTLPVASPGDVTPQPRTFVFGYEKKPWLDFKHFDGQMLQSQGTYLLLPSDMSLLYLESATAPSEGREPDFVLYGEIPSSLQGKSVESLALTRTGNQLGRRGMNALRDAMARAGLKPDFITYDDPPSGDSAPDATSEDLDPEAANHLFAGRQLAQAILRCQMREQACTRDSSMQRVEDDTAAPQEIVDWQALLEEVADGPVEK